MSENTEVHSPIIAQIGKRGPNMINVFKELALSFFSSYPSADNSPIIAAVTAVKNQTIKVVDNDQSHISQNSKISIPVEGSETKISGEVESANNSQFDKAA